MFKSLKKRDKNVVEQPLPSSGANTTILPPSFPKHTPIGRRLRQVLVTLVVLGVVTGAVLLLGYMSDPNQLRKKVVIGDTTITQQDVDKYAKQAENFYKLGQNNLGELPDFKKMALDDLVMAAALGKEAKERGMSASVADLEKFNTERFNTEDLRRDSKALLAEPDVADAIMLKTKILYYQQKLQTTLIDSKDFLMVQIPFDTPYHHSKTPQEQKQLHQQASKQLEDRFVPLIKEGKSSEEISKLADVNPEHPDQHPADPDFYKNRLFTYSQLVKDFPNKEFKEFNDIETNDEVFGWHIENLVDTDDMLNSLKNVGDSTPVFASKAGAHMVMRLESRRDGVYRSNNQMLTSYKDQYTKTALQKARLSLNTKVKSFQRWLNSLVSSMPLLDNTVHAADSCNHSTHEVNFVFRSYNQFGFEVPGVRVYHYGRGICYADNYSLVTTANFPENCNDNAPVWDRAPEPGYTITWDWTYPGWATGLNSWGVVNTAFWVYYPYSNFVNTANAYNTPGPATVTPGSSATLTASITSSTPGGWFPMNSTNPTHLLVRNENPSFISGSTATMSGPNSPYGINNYYSPGPGTWDWVWTYSALTPGSTTTTTFNIQVAANTPPGAYCFQSYAYPSSYGSGVWSAGSRSCITVVAQDARPFVTTEFGDIHAGTTWGESACLVSPSSDASPGNIQGQVSGSNGSKADYIISAGGSISGFGSAGDPGGANSNQLKFGGNTGGYGQICRPDIAKRFINDPTSYTALGVSGALYTIADVGSLASGVYYHNGNVEITGTSTIPVGKSITFIVNGTVLIDNNINQGAGNITLNTIPTFGLVATGNINVHENVTHLYGIYNAGSSLPGSIGVINTCQNNHSTVAFSPALKTTNACNNALVVEGAMIANNIYFRRKPPTSNVTANNNPAERVSLIPQLFLRPPVGFSTVSLQLRSEGERPPVY